MIKCSIGIMAYNEENNIGQLISAILSQKLVRVKINEITVVASGCTDGTIHIVKNFSQKDSRIKLIIQERREGKSSAINLWLEKSQNEILVLESADTIPKENSIENLVLPFEDPKVGMTGACPIPIDDPSTFMGFTSHLMWRLHHLISLENPKMGEMVAFRKIFDKIPENSAVDEASIEQIIKSKGYKIEYVSTAIVNNKGPETVQDFLKQRRRVYAGHLTLEKESYSVATLNGVRIFLVLLKNTQKKFKLILWTLLVVFLEILGRFLGWYDFAIAKKSHRIWKISATTKKLTN